MPVLRFKYQSSRLSLFERSSRKGTYSTTYVDAVHHMEKLLYTILMLKPFPTLYSFGTFMEVFGGSYTLCILTLFSDRWSGLYNFT